MSLPDLSQMGIWGWVVLILIVAVSAISIFVVKDEEKKGRPKPGASCGGKPVEEESVNTDGIML